MSIVSCPQCGKKISSQAPLCLHCGFQPGAISDEQMLVYQQKRARDRVHHLKLTSYVVITAFISAFGWYWWATGGFQQPSTPGPFITMQICALAYLVIRGLLYQARRRQKGLN